MINPQLFGVSPEKMAQAQRVGEYVEARFTKRRRQHRFTVEFLPRKPEVEMAAANMDLAQVVDLMVEQIATQLYTFFGIGGKIQDVE